jgi:hypothetical protein
MANNYNKKFSNKSIHYLFISFLHLSIMHLISCGGNNNNNLGEVSVEANADDESNESENNDPQFYVEDESNRTKSQIQSESPISSADVKIFSSLKDPKLSNGLWITNDENYCKGIKYRSFAEELHRFTSTAKFTNYLDFYFNPDLHRLSTILKDINDIGNKNNVTSKDCELYLYRLEELVTILEKRDPAKTTELLYVKDSNPNFISTKQAKELKDKIIKYLISNVRKGIFPLYADPYKMLTPDNCTKYYDGLADLYIVLKKNGVSQDTSIMRIIDSLGEDGFIGSSCYGGKMREESLDKKGLQDLKNELEKDYAAMRALLKGIANEAYFTDHLNIAILAIISQVSGNRLNAQVFEINM